MAARSRGTRDIPDCCTREIRGTFRQPLHQWKHADRELRSPAECAPPTFQWGTGALACRSGGAADERRPVRSPGQARAPVPPLDFETDSSGERTSRPPGPRRDDVGSRSGRADEDVRTPLVAARRRVHPGTEPYCCSGGCHRSSAALQGFEASQGRRRGSSGTSPTVNAGPSV